MRKAALRPMAETSQDAPKQKESEKVDEIQEQRLCSLF